MNSYKTILRSLNPAAPILLALFLLLNAVSAMAQNPQYYQYSVRHEKGTPPFFPILSMDGESVNSANGNLFFNIPLVSRPGRNGLGINLALSYNSKFWDYYWQNGVVYAAIPEGNSWVGPGWTLLVARVIDSSTLNGHFYVTLSDGATHDLVYYGGAYRSKDSTYMIYDPVSHKLTLKGGTKITFDHVDQQFSYMRYATRVQDTNGNYIEISYQGAGGRISSIQDTLGNSYAFTLNGNGRLQYLTYWNTNDVGQPTSTITFSYQYQTLEYGDAPTDSQSAPQYMLRYIYFPTGNPYQFAYRTSGEMTEITYPTCGKSRYSYTTYSFGDWLLGTAVPDHLISSHDHNTSDAWTWTYNLNGNAAPYWAQITFPGGNTVTHYMQKSSPGWASGLLTKMVQSGSPGTESRQDWAQDDESTWTIVNPRVTYKEQVLKGTTEQVVRTEFGYAATTDYSGNVKEIREYSFAGALRRKTTLSYLHESNSAYVPLNIIDRVTTALVYNGANVLQAKSVTAYDVYSPLYTAANAIRHDAAFGPAYTMRGLPSTVTKWYDIANNLSVTSSIKYDECGNPRETTDPRLNTSIISYWLSSADNAYAFPLRVVNAKGHVISAVYSYKSGVVLSRTDANNKVTTMTYDAYDRLIRVAKPSGGVIKYTYSEPACYVGSPSVLIEEQISGPPGDPNGKYRSKRSQLDNMGRPIEAKVTDPVGGNIKTENEYGTWSQLSAVTVPHREADPPPLNKTTYIYGGVSQLDSVTLAEGGTISYAYDHNHRTVTNTDGHKRRNTYQEDGRISEVLDEDASGQLTVATTYSYDSMGRLITITQGVQTRSFTYDNLGRLKSETHPESGTTTYTYDANSNLLTKTGARGITTTYTYDELNRVTQKTYSDSTPSASYFYDSQPSGSPIATLNPVGRLTRVSTTASGVTNSSYYSYCNCSSIDSEATVITDGITKTYITSYIYNYVGGITSITYPNGKVVTYTRDDVGRETKVSSTVLGQPIDYVRSASYLGPSGQLSQIDYGIMNGGSWVSTLYSYSPKTLRLTFYQTYGLRETLQYGKPDNPAIQTGQIYDIVDEYYPAKSQHFDYDNWYRLTSYQVSWGRGGAYSRNLQWTYDRYNNIATKRNLGDPGNCPWEGCLAVYYSDSATNRLLGLDDRMMYGFSYDNAGNETSDGKTYDAENRLTSAPGQSYLYDGNSRRMRILGGSTKIYYIYSAAGLLLTEDNWTESTTTNQIYFNGQLVATHNQDDYVRFYFKDHLGSVLSVLEVTPGGEYWPCDWQLVEANEYAPYGTGAVNFPSQSPKYKYTGKPLDRTGLEYYGARYYSIFTSHWTSADSLTAHIYDPQSLNKYTYVRNDPVNWIDPDGRLMESPFNWINGELAWWLWFYNFDLPWRPGEDGGGYGGGGGGGAPPVQSLDALLGNKALLESGLKTRAGIEEKKGKCYDFLVKVIGQLSGGGRTGRGSGSVLAANFTVETLVSNVMAAAKTATTVAQLKANARTLGNAISIARDPVEPMGNDYFSTLLHEGFHMLMSSGGRSQISDDRLKDATSFADGTKYQGGLPSEFNKQMFEQNCGPGL